MKIKLEKYLQKNQAKLDVEEPDDVMLWEGIRKGIISERKSSGFNFWKIAAIFLAVFTLSYIVYNEVSKDREREFTLSHIDKTLGDREKAYRELVMMKMEAADFNAVQQRSGNDILQILVNELNELDTIYLEAMNDLKQHGYMEQIVEIIFDTYEKRIRILEQIILETQKLEKYENDMREISL